MTFSAGLRGTGLSQGKIVPGMTGRARAGATVGVYPSYTEIGPGLRGEATVITYLYYRTVTLLTTTYGSAIPFHNLPKEVVETPEHLCPLGVVAGQKLFSFKIMTFTAVLRGDYDGYLHIKMLKSIHIAYFPGQGNEAGRRILQRLSQNRLPYQEIPDSLQNSC